MFYIIKFILVAINRILGTVFVFFVTPMVTIGLTVVFVFTWIWLFKPSPKVMGWIEEVYEELIISDLWNAVRFKSSALELITRGEMNDE